MITLMQIWFTACAILGFISYGGGWILGIITFFIWVAMMEETSEGYE